MSGRFEPEKMPDEYSRAVRELVKAKVEHPEVMIEADGKPRAPVINIMDALKKSMPRCAIRCGSEWARLHPKTTRLDQRYHAAASVRGAVSIRNALWSVLVSFLFDHRDTDLPLLCIARFVAKIKNTSRKAKPFSALPEGPYRVSFREQVH
jgi:hypothetical protein